MTLLTFNTMKDKLLNLEKLQTIRYNADYWVKRLEKNPKLDMWWRNPRTKKYNPDCKKLGVAEGSIYGVVEGRNITRELATEDGFLGMNELLKWFVPKLTTEAILEFCDHEYAVIRWVWIDTYWLSWGEEKMIISLKDAIDFLNAYAYQKKHKKRYWRISDHTTMETIIKRWNLQGYSYDEIAFAIKSTEARIHGHQ